MPASTSTSEGGEPGGFTVAVTRQGDPSGTQVEFARYGAETDPDDLLDLRNTPRARVFDEGAADHLVSTAGYERTTDWQWAGDWWVAVVQPKTGLLGER